MIEVENLTKHYGTKLALNELNMNVMDGSVYGLVGPNGAGKTTVINHISGAYKPDSGSVFIDGEPVFENVAAKSKIAYIPTDFYYVGHARISDMKKLYASIYPTFDANRFEELSSVFGMDQGLNVRSLSKGMKKQLAFWLALSQRCEYLLLDEPVDGLDPNARHKVWSLVMEEVAQRGLTVLVSSHNLRELTDVCDCVGIIDDGCMRIERNLTELQDNFVKAQIAFADENDTLPEGLDILHSQVEGKLATYVVRASADEVCRRLSEKDVKFLNLLPLSLEEIFIYELGGDSNEAR